MYHITNQQRRLSTADFSRLRTLGLFIILAFLLPLGASAAIVFDEDWSTGGIGWTGNVLVWQVGTPTTGPSSCGTGSIPCLGTSLNGLYDPNADSQFISPSIGLPALAAGEEIHLRFEHWFSYSSGDLAQVQISVWDSGSSTWGAWTDVGRSIEGGASDWSTKDVDLTDFAGETVRIGFSHSAADLFNVGGLDNSDGWFIDDVVIISGAPAFTGDFEAGWVDWGADRGIWQIGTPTAGPSACASGTQCAGTHLDDLYHPNTDSRLVSASILVPSSAAVALAFRSWVQYSSGDSGEVQISVFDSGTGTWGNWTTLGSPVTNTSEWKVFGFDLTAQAGETVRIGFSHSAADLFNVGGSDNANGWFVDGVMIGPDVDADLVPDIGDNCILESNLDQRDTNGDGFGNICDPDLNNDGLVTVTDFLILRGVLNTPDPDADLNGDGLVTVTDFLILRSFLNQPPGPSALAP